MLWESKIKNRFFPVYLNNFSSKTFETVRNCKRYRNSAISKGLLRKLKILVCAIFSYRSLYVHFCSCDSNCPPGLKSVKKSPPNWEVVRFFSAFFFEILRSSKAFAKCGESQRIRRSVFQRPFFGKIKKEKRRRTRFRSLGHFFFWIRDERLRQKFSLAERRKIPFDLPFSHD